MNRIIFILSFLTIHCHSGSGKPSENKQATSTSLGKKKLPPSLETQVLSDTQITLTSQKRKIDVLYPAQFQKKVLWVFHGWNFSRLDWCQKTNLCQKALDRGYIVVLPDLGKSIYASRFFPETWPSLKTEPTLSYVTDTLFSFFQQYIPNASQDIQWFIMGLSTGAHGTGLIVERTDTLFTAAALLSGDYDQTKLPQDKIFQANYGLYSNFPKRWKDFDNVVTHANKFKIPAYIGHGQQDEIIPIQQSEYLFQALEKQFPQITHIYAPMKGKHDYIYWGSQTLPILDFFDAHSY